MKNNLFPICMIVTVAALIFVLVMQALECRAYALF